MKHLVGFFICGLINNFGYSLMLSAALDMLEEFHLPPAVVLVADIVPCFLVQVLLEFHFSDYYSCRLLHHGLWTKFPICVIYSLFVNYSYSFSSIRIIAVIILSIASCLFPAFFSSLWLKMVGVVCASIASGLGEITFLAYTSRFHK
jgi:battenin